MRRKQFLKLAVLFFGVGQLFSCGGSGGNSGGGDPAISVTITPPAPMVGLNQTIVFTVVVSGGGDANVIWGVEENGGGAINQTGTYTAPNTTGTYHVIATSQADHTRKGIAPVTVVVIP